MTKSAFIWNVNLSISLSLSRFRSLNYGAMHPSFFAGFSSDVWPWTVSYLELNDVDTIQCTKRTEMKNLIDESPPILPSLCTLARVFMKYSHQLVSIMQVDLIGTHKSVSIDSEIAMGIRLIRQFSIFSSRRKTFLKNCTRGGGESKAAPRLKDCNREIIQTNKDWSVLTVSTHTNC